MVSPKPLYNRKLHALKAHNTPPNMSQRYQTPKKQNKIKTNA